VRALIAFFSLCLLATAGAYAQSVGAGAGAGFTQLGGLQDYLGTEQPFALTVSGFFDFTLGASNVRMIGTLGAVEDLLISSFETNLFWTFPFGRETAFLGAGSGMLGVPPAVSRALHFTLQALAGLETPLLNVALVRITVQAMGVLVLNQGGVPGAPAVRLEVGVVFPLGI